MASSYRGNRLLAFDVATGTLAGACAATRWANGQVPLTANGQPTFDRGYTFVMPQVAGAQVVVVPDNKAVGDGPGGVRDLHTGALHELGFPGWTVITAIGRRLVLEQNPPAGDGVPTSPAAWCVLPDVTAAQSACTRLPTATTPGTPSVAPDGSLGWTPLAGRRLRVGSTYGYVATDGRGYVSGFARPQHPAPNSSYLKNPIPIDEQTIAALPNSAAPFSKGPSTLQWAHVALAGGRLSATVHDTGITTANPLTEAVVEGRRHLLLEAGDIRGIVASPDAHSITVISSDCSVYRFTDSGQRITLPRLQAPAGADCGYLVSWPAPAPARS